MKTRNHDFFNIKNGFTLAEVLITLVIIGVIAALAISPLVNTYVESSTVAKVKKGLSILGQAKKLAEVQNGSIEGWDFDGSDTTASAAQFWSYLKPHISLAKDCGSGTDCYQSDGIYHLDGQRHSVNQNLDTRFYKFILSDGSVMYFRIAYGGKCSSSEGNVDSKACALFFYDVNGTKAPNTYGRDVFVYVMATDGIYPFLNNSCRKSSSGESCVEDIIKHGNMKYLH